MINEALNNNKKQGIFIISKDFDKPEKTRKDDLDNIRKKFKTGFHRNLKNGLNEKLKSAGSILFFKCLPQKFITNITKQVNKNILNLTLEQILSKDFCSGLNVNSSINEKYADNLKALKYLENKKDISKKSNFINIKNMKYFEVIYEYLNSKEFENEILKLKLKEKFDDIYIKKYINAAINLVDFFKN